MGKFILGIMAVILVQIAFGIYVSQDKSADISTSESRALLIDPTVAPVEPENIVSPTTEAEDPVAAEVRPRRAEPSRPGEMPRKLRPAYRSTHRSTDLTSNNQRSLMSREYFGGMVVERSFDVKNNRKQNVLNGVERQYFGKMLVERRSSISGVRTKNRLGFAVNRSSPARSDGRRG